MRWLPLLNNEPHTFITEDLPSLIHGEEHSGASLFTMTLFTEFYKQGHPLLFLTGYDLDKDVFVQQAGVTRELITITDKASIEDAETHQVIYLAKEQSSLLPDLLATLPDLQERIILLKNIEAFTSETIALLSDHLYTIYSGNLNNCPAKEDLLQLKYNTKIFFSPLHNDFRLTLPPLKKYHGYFLGRISQGTVSLQDTITSTS